MPDGGAPLTSAGPAAGKVVCLHRPATLAGLSAAAYDVSMQRIFRPSPAAHPGPSRRWAAPAATMALSLLLGGCAIGFMKPPLPGQTEAEVVQRFGAPTGRYAMPGGVTRLEYATGPYGRETWMVDLDAGGRVTGARQVLGEASFDSFQRLAPVTGPGIPREQVLRTLGRPGEVRGGGWQGGQVWSWRYPTNDCLWFQVSIGDDGLTRGGAFGPDPLCDRDLALFRR